MDKGKGGALRKQREKVEQEVVAEERESPEAGVAEDLFGVVDKARKERKLKVNSYVEFLFFFLTGRCPSKRASVRRGAAGRNRRRTSQSPG